MPRRKLKTTVLLMLFCATAAQALPSIGAILDKARTKLGSPYVSGSEGPSSFDCSGFIYYLFSGLIPGLPRRSAALGSFGRPIQKNDLLPGDIILYATTPDKSRISHVALYLGNDTIIHAISDGPNRGVTMTSIHARYWETRYHSARRILPPALLAQNEEPEGRADETSRHEPSGTGIVFAKGVYRGGLKYSEPDGKGRFEFKNGDVYEGGFSKGQFSGQGTYTWNDGTVYKGSFDRGNATGILPGGKKLYMNVEDSPWESWDGNVWGDFKDWQAQEMQDFEAYKQKDARETKNRM